MLRNWHETVTEEFADEAINQTAAPAENRMQESYSEISANSIGVADHNLKTTNVDSPSSIWLFDAAPASFDDGTKNAYLLTNDVSAFPYNLDGTVTKDGNIINFTAENLDEIIRSSNSHQAAEYYSPSNVEWDMLPSQRAIILPEIELEARYLAESVDNLSENLGNLLHSISAITADNVEIHKNATHKLTDSMDSNIKSMYTIMAKTEEITKSMQLTDRITQRIREIKRLVDMMDGNL